MPSSLAQLLATQSDVLSYELFPPKTEAGEAALYRHAEQLLEFEPSFITCTYGAGGSTQSKTLAITAEVKRRFELPVASHLTLVGSTREQLIEYLQQARQAGVDTIVALRGDPPRGESEFQQTPGGLRYANQLVELIREEFGDAFGILVAGYPEKHLEAPSMEVDLENLKRKVDAGADAVVTQLFYDNEDFFRFVDQCHARQIDVPIVPGILPVINFEQIQRITGMCGARLPDSFTSQLQSAGGDLEQQFAVGVEYATRQVQQLLEQGVPGIHFYVLNKSRATLEVLRNTSFGSNQPSRA